MTLLSRPLLLAGRSLPVYAVEGVLFNDTVQPLCDDGANNYGRLISMKHLSIQVLISILALFAVLIVTNNPANAAIIYSNNFETNTAGFDVTDVVILPSDSIGGVSTYLGQAPNTTSAVLTLTGLTPGTVYNLAFDLYIGGTWDGSLSFGPDTFSLTSSSSGLLVNATFRNGFPIGNLTPSQTYSDATPLGNGGLFRTREGADVELSEPIYYFGHGAGNPLLSFTATSTTELISFQSVNAEGAGGGEYFALDNVVVSYTKLDQTITFNAAPTVVVGGTGTVSATGGASPNPVTFSSTTPSVCTVLGATVTGVSAGTCIIAADQAGDGSYNAAPQVTQSFAVSAPVVATAIPTLSEWGVILLAGMLGLFGMGVMWRRARVGR